MHSSNFTTIQQQLLELIGYRSKILSGTLTVDELKDVKRLATACVDTGNQLLGLDMVVRDEHGNVLNPERTSTIELYYHHETAAERIRKATNETKKKPIKSTTPVFSHIFFVSVRNFVCKMSEDVELLLTLYDAKETRAITENYVVSWSKEGLARDIDQLHNLRVLFTDLGSRDLARDKVYLVCYAIRVGGMDAKEADHRRSSIVQQQSNNNQKIKSHDSMRRPFGVAAMDITLYVTGKLEGDPDHHHFIPFVQYVTKFSILLLIVSVSATTTEYKYRTLEGCFFGFAFVLLPAAVRRRAWMALCGEFSRKRTATFRGTTAITAAASTADKVYGRV